MIILHGGFFEKNLYLWGEVPLEIDHQKTKKRKRNGRGFFPYDAGSERLTSALKDTVHGIKPEKRSFKELILWLPSADGTPSVSSEMIGEPLRSSLPDALSPWKITGFRVSQEGMVDLLYRCLGKKVLGPGVILGKDLSFWARALQFAGALVAKEQFLPSVVKARERFYTRWEPVFLGEDQIRLATLARAMPGVCRALSDQSDSPPSRSSPSVFEEFVSMLVDSIVRLSFKDHILGGRKVSCSSVHDQWLESLLSSSTELRGDLKELSRFADQFEDWKRPLFLSMQSPVRLCFRIEEPDGDLEEGGKDQKKEQRWYVRYLLQWTEDPSLLLSVEDIWEGRYPSFLKKGLSLHESLLSSLGQASRICPHVEKSLKTTRPVGYELDVREAYEFLTEKVKIFERWGFGVILPSWWAQKGSKLRFTAHANVKAPKMRTLGGLSLDQVVQFDWEISLGNERLSYEDLRDLARLKAPLVRMKGQWVEVNPKEIQAILEFLKKRETQEATLREVVRMALGGGSLPGDISLGGIRAEGWVKDLVSKLCGQSSYEELPKPAGFQGVLRPYQVRGYSWLSFLKDWGFGACLADDMGLGKTIQTLSLIQRDWEMGNRRPVLLICPTSIVSNWKKEASRFTPGLPVMVHHGLERKRGEEFKRRVYENAMVISSYALLSRDFEILKEIEWGGVILDEAQNIKNPETKQSRAARALRAGYRITLTGTPVENHVGDLWSIMEFLNPGFLGSQTEFKRNFFIPIQAARDSEVEEKLRRLTGPFILRRLKTDKTIISDLPEKVEAKVFCTLTCEQASLYEAVVNEIMGRIDRSEGIERKGLVLSTIIKLKQVCNHPAQFLGDRSKIPGRSGKLERLREMIEEMVEVGDRALIFSQFAEMGAILKRYVEETFGFEVPFLHGGVEKKKRDHMIERFQSEEDGPPLFILSLKAGGTGLNLTRANRVIHFDRWWNPAVEDQATDRAFRIGQMRNVMVHKFICAGTFEERIDEMIERKKEIAARVVGTGEDWLTELSTDELRDLFALRKEAIGG